jgi:repressor LexA
MALKVASGKKLAPRMRGPAGKLTKRQSEIYSYIQECQREDGVIPTLQEICQHFGFKSINAAREHLRLIERKGLLVRSPGQPRAIKLAIRLPEANDDIQSVPLLGRIAAGQPSLAIEEIEDTLSLPRQLFRGKRLFALRVRGDSMIGAGIFDGDVAVLDAERDARDGDIAAVVVEGEATLKRIYKNSKGLRLHAENPSIPERFVPANEYSSIRITGVLVGTMRKF